VTAAVTPAGSSIEIAIPSQITGLDIVSSVTINSQSSSFITINPSTTSTTANPIYGLSLTGLTNIPSSPVTIIINSLRNPSNFSRIDSAVTITIYTASASNTSQSNIISQSTQPISIVYSAQATLNIQVTSSSQVVMTTPVSFVIDAFTLLGVPSSAQLVINFDQM